MLGSRDAGYAHVGLARLHRRERGPRKSGCRWCVTRWRAARSCSRRRFVRGSLTLAALGLLTGCGIAPRFGQPPPKVPVIGFLSPGPREARARMDAGFLQGLRDLGYAEGQHIAIEYRYAEGNDRLPALAAELVGLAVDVILAGGGTPAPLAAQRATATIPIVFIAASDPVGTGLVASLARPAGNLTGLAGISAELAGSGWNCSRRSSPASRGSRSW